MIRLDSSNTQCQGLDAREIAYALGHAHKSGRSWQTQCPSHGGTGTSLTITDKGDKVLFHCFSGCTQDQVLRAVAALNLIPNNFGNGFQITAAHLAAVNKAMRSAKWVGVAGATDYAVLSAHLQIARRVNKVQHGASCRELAELAGVGKSAASSVNHRLVKAGWLMPLHRTDLVEANKWELRVPKCLVGKNLQSDRNLQSQSGIESGPDPAKPRVSADVTITTSAGTTPEEENRNGSSADNLREHSSLQRFDCPGYFPFSADIWSWGKGLGKSKGRIYAMLPATVAELSSRLGVSQRAIRYLLAGLENVQLVEREDNRVWLRTNVSPDLVAVALGVYGVGDRRRVQHQQQRVGFERYLEAIASTAKPGRQVWSEPIHIVWPSPLRVVPDEFSVAAAAG